MWEELATVSTLWSYQPQKGILTPTFSGTPHAWLGDQSNPVEIYDWSHGSVLVDQGGNLGFGIFSLPLYAIAKLSPAKHPLTLFCSQTPLNVISYISDFKTHQLEAVYLIKNHISTSFSHLPSIYLWLMIEVLYQSDFSDKSIGDIIKLKQADLIEQALGSLPARMSAIKLLKKTIGFSYLPEDLPILKRLFKNKEALRHLKHFNKIYWPAVKDFIQLKRPWAPAFQKIICNTTGSECKRLYLEIIKLTQDLESLGETLSLNDYTIAIRRCSSLELLQKLHTSWVKKNTLIQAKSIDFPEPPLIETKNIIAIRNLQELMQEGSELKHCAGALHKPILSKKTYFYKIKAPQRATLQIRKSQIGWQISEYQTIDRSPLTPETREEIAAWLEENANRLQSNSRKS